MSARPTRKGNKDDRNVVPQDPQAERNVLAHLCDFGRNSALLVDVRREHFFCAPHPDIFDAFTELLAGAQACGVGDVAAALTRKGLTQESMVALTLPMECGTVPVCVAALEIEKLAEASQRRARLADLARERMDLYNLSLPVADTLTASAANLERIRGQASGGGADCVGLGDLRYPKPNDASELLRHRFQCRGGGLLVVGPTGIGKSSLIMQAIVLWALGRACFGITPARPLRSLLIQAENDDGDLAEMRDGVLSGLNLSAEERDQATAAILVHRDDTRTGTDFFTRTVEPRLRVHQPDQLVIDPALAYIGGESNSQRDVGAFLRNGLNPLLHRYDCGGIVLHHTNKPPTGKEKTEWSGGDFAYLGGGSAEWANWARAVIAVRSMGSNEVFEMRLAKRGGRVGWKSPTGEREFARLIGHSKEPGVIYWREADASELDNPASGAAAVHSADGLLEILGKSSLTYSRLLERAVAQGWHKRTFDRRLKDLKDGKRVLLSPLDNEYSAA